MSTRSVFAVSRAIWADGDFPNEPFTQREAWIWLIGAAAWKDIRTRGNTDKVINLKRGEFSFATRFLAEKWQWSKSRVDRVIQTLEKRGTIRDASRDGSKVYSITKYNHFQVVGLPKRDSEWDDARDNDGTAAGQQRDKEETLKQLNSKTEQQEGVAGAPVGGDLFPVSRETSKALVVVHSIPDWVPLDAWNGYLQMRKKIRMANTDRAIGMLLKKLDEFRMKGHDPTAILDEATTKNWKSLYEPKADQSNGNARQKPPSANDKNLAGAALAIASLGSHADQCGETEVDRDAGGSLLPLLDPGLYPRAGGGAV